MGWLEEVGEGSAEEVLARLQERLHEHLECVGLALEMETELDEEDGCVCLEDQRGTSAFFWFGNGVDGGLLLHYTAPVCVVPEEAHAFFSNMLLEGAAFQSFLKFNLLEGVVSLVGSLPAEELNGNLVTRVAHDIVAAAKPLMMTLVHLHGARPWHEAWEEPSPRSWAAPEPAEGVDSLERYRRNALSVMRRTERSRRTVAAAVKTARDVWARGPLTDDELDRRLRGRLVSLLLDLNTLDAFRVTRDDDDDLFLHHNGFALCVGFMPRRDYDTFLYCFTGVCRLPDENREAVYETLLKEGTHPWCAKTYILGDSVGVCGYQNIRTLTDTTARELLFETLDLAESVHETLTLLHGLQSLRKEQPPPAPKPGPDPATGELYEEE